MKEPEFFPLFGWSHNKWLARPRPIEEDLNEIAECGLNIACFARVEELDLCQKYGLRAIISDQRLRYDWTQEVSQKEIEENVDSFLKDVGDRPAFYSYYLTDEPGPRTYKQKYPNLARVVKAVRERTPNKLPYLNLLPASDKWKTGEYETYLRMYVEMLNPPYVSFDNYALYEDGSLAYYYFSNLEAIRCCALEYHIPFWHVILSLAHRRYREPTEADMRFQVYTSLAYGAQGITYFTYHAPNVGNYLNAPVDHFGHKTRLWDLIRNLNLQIAVLAPILLKLKSTGIYHWPDAPYGCNLLPGDSLVRGFRSEVGHGWQGGTGQFLVGEFEHADGTPYVMIVNKSFTRSTRFEAEINGSYELHKVSSFSGSAAPIIDGEEWWLGPGQGILIKLVQK